MSVGLGVAQDRSASPPAASRTPKVLQGIVREVNGNMLVLESKGGMPHGRQVDISSASYESEAGEAVQKLQLKAGDRILVVIDPAAPTTWRPKPEPGRPMPMFIRVLPLKAMVVELISTANP